MKTQEEVEKVYYTPSKGFQSLNKQLWKRLQEEKIQISYNDLKKILEQQETYQLNKQVRKPK